MQPRCLNCFIDILGFVRDKSSTSVNRLAVKFKYKSHCKIVFRTIVSRLWRMGVFFESVILLVVVQMDGMPNG